MSIRQSVVCTSESDDQSVIVLLIVHPQTKEAMNTNQEKTTETSESTSITMTTRSSSSGRGSNGTVATKEPTSPVPRPPVTPPRRIVLTSNGRANVLHPVSPPIDYGNKPTTMALVQEGPVDYEQTEALIQEDEDGGDGGDSDLEGEEYDLHEPDDSNESERLEEDVELAVEQKPGIFVSMHKITKDGWTKVDDSIVLDQGESERKPKIPTPDPDWKAPAVKASKGEPTFDKVDNPGNWNEFYFRPTFKKGSQGRYTGHQLPTGAVPVPKDKDGVRQCGDWKFHYNGYTNPDMPYRHGASTSNLFPEEMKGSLDVDILRKLGLTQKVMQEVDALFFFQLLLPFCDPSKSGLVDDPRRPYYTEVERFTNASKYLSGSGGSYGHTWEETTAAELLRHDAVLIFDGVLGGSNGALYRRWDEYNCMYSPDIAKSMTMTRYGELKRNKKLCINEATPKRGEPGYNPAYKYDLVYAVMVFNINAISRKADENQVIDESTWGHGGYGESGSGITTRLMNKKVCKGGQVVLIMDR